MNLKNNLGNESNPYLLQHANNPIAWQAWNKEILEQALNSDKMILISIGYASCHWCHVMEKESFEDIDVAAIMNENFINIKVDREALPHVDAYFMNACSLSQQQGGWPLHAFCLPNSLPFYLGTYFPKNTWISVLQQITNLYKNERQKLISQATYIHKAIEKMNTFHWVNIDVFSENNIEKLWVNIENWKRNLDLQYGGKKGYPKFPMPNVLIMAMDILKLQYDEAISSWVKVTLEKMYAGGIYDHVGGGFARYSTDEIWQVPHFEKMLYDNAQLLNAYAQAALYFKNNNYAEIAIHIYNYLNKEMKDTSGLYYSSYDADSEGVEGKFYTWSYDEVQEILKEDFLNFAHQYTISKEGNWEEVNILMLRNNFSTPDLQMQKSLDKLYIQRKQRVPPALDFKCILSWNALQLEALCNLYKIDNNEKLWIEIKTLYSNIEKYFKKKDGTYFRIVSHMKANTDALLEDYAYYIKALLCMYTINFDEVYLQQAQSLFDYTLSHFYNNDMFYLHTIVGHDLPFAITDLQDNVCPSPVSVMAYSAFWLYQYFEHDKYKKVSQNLCFRTENIMLQHPTFYHVWVQTFILWQTPINKVVITGTKANIEAKTLQQSCWKNNKLWIFIIPHTKNSSLPCTQHYTHTLHTEFYVCKGQLCLAPVQSIESVLELLA